jgi:two-component system, cell cycle sensor histidine kinase and response regulator CckA
MKRALRVLFVEDSPTDCELLARELERQGFELNHARVESRQAMRLALEQAEWDLVLADFRLIGFSGVDALGLLQEQRLDLPFILVSGSLESRAVAEAMRAGAHDYIQKNSLTRLGPAVERELREAEVRRDLRRALKDVQAGAERLRMAASASNTGLWEWNLVTNEVFYSPEWKAQMGFQDDEPPNRWTEWEERLHPDDREQTLERVRAHLANPSVRFSTEFRLRHRDGSWRWIRSVGQMFPDDAGRPARMFGAHHEITESKRMEEEVLRAQRMESIGALAGGLAHDLNNILAPILLSTTVLRDAVSGADAQELVDAVETSAQRGTDLVKQMLDFARGRGCRRVLLHPRQILSELVRFLPRFLARSCEVVTEFPANLWALEGDPTQLHQVLLNLCVNARDAMPEGGRLTLTAANVQADEALLAAQPGARPGPYVRLDVSDTGTGIPAAQLEKVFEPFYTTKASGCGTGLGLATVQTIVRSHGGFVHVESSLDSGARFRVYLPARPDAQLPEPACEPGLVERGRGELLLLTDDEAALREVMKDMLETNGYRVITAAEGLEGFMLFLRHRGEIQLVITDVVMPRLDGVRLVRAIRKVEPETRILASSGVDLSEGAEGPRKELETLGVAGFLQKPYRVESLLQRVREILDAPTRPPVGSEPEAIPGGGMPPGVSSDPRFRAANPPQVSHLRRPPAPSPSSGGSAA